MFWYKNWNVFVEVILFEVGIGIVCWMIGTSVIQVFNLEVLIDLKVWRLFAELSLKKSQLKK